MSPVEDARRRMEQQEALFFHVLQTPEMDRISTLEAATADDLKLREEVLAMLQAEHAIQERISSFSPADNQMRRGAVAQSDPADWIGRELGPFRIEQFLGRGGMGVVFRAHRAHGHLQQTVALKVIADFIQAPETVRQFESERDLLASMSHPNVARLIDAGVVAGGTPYIAMEFVEGTSLDAALKDTSISDTEKLGYLLQLCDAVEYVHDRLVLHRDIKPNNVFVTSEGRIKLLDFGVAKLLTANSEDTALTRAGLRPVAPRYASPERMTGGNLSTASDVYSLGAILGFYLHGSPTANSQTGEDMVADAVKREATRHYFGAVMQRELEAIVRKAMQSAPQDRYASARAFADDLHAALENRTTKARRYAPRDRVLLFLRRNKLRLAAVSLLMLLVLAGMAAIARQTFLVRREVERNQLALGQEEKLIHLLLFDFFDRLKSIPGSTDTQRATLNQAVGYLDKLEHSGNADLESGLQDDAVAAYTELGNLQGSPYEENLGDREGALKTLKKAVVLAQSLSDAAPKDLDRKQALAVAEQALGRVYFGGGEPQNALTYIERADQAAMSIAESPRATTAQIAQAAAIADTLGDVYDLQGAANLGDAPRANTAYERAMQMDKRGAVSDPQCERCLRGIALEEWKIALTLETTNDAAAMQHLQQGLADLATVPERQRASAKFIRLDNVLRNALGSLQEQMGKHRESLETLTPVHERFTTAIQNDPHDSRARYDRLALDPEYGSAYAALGDDANASATFHEMLGDADWLLRSDATSDTLQMGRARALILMGGLDTGIGANRTRPPALQEGISLAVRVADKKDASPEALNFIAETLMHNPGALPDALTRARDYTQRAIAVSRNATAVQSRRLADIDREQLRRMRKQQ